MNSGQSMATARSSAAAAKSPLVAHIEMKKLERKMWYGAARPREMGKLGFCRCRVGFYRRQRGSQEHKRRKQRNNFYLKIILFCYNHDLCMMVMTLERLGKTSLYQADQVLRSLSIYHNCLASKYPLSVL